ncbi:MAG: fasciclin domain-containing protein [Phycisphaerales bacterium]
MKTTNVLAILAVAGAAGLSGVASAQDCPLFKGSCSDQKPAVTAASHLVADDIVDTAVKAGKFNTLAVALKAAGLVDTLKGAGPFTVFAPTDEAFAKLPKGTLDELLKPENKAKLTAILTYHVVPGSVLAADVTKLSNATTVNGQRVDIKTSGGKVMIDGATVTATDVKTSNGVIHVIDTVIMPSTDDVVDTAVKAGSFKTLAAALKAAGLVDALKGSGPFTVFAPTDDAFAKLPKGTLDDLLKPENKDKLVSILKYHVVSGRVFSTDAVAAKHAKTLQGGEVKITSDGGVKIDNAGVVSADLDASNGVIHVIDTVIMPKSN